MYAQIFGGGTVSYVRGHLALCAPAYGQTARAVYGALGNEFARLSLTRMADYTSRLETNVEVAKALTGMLQDPELGAIFFNVALCDFDGQIGDVESGKYAERLQSRAGEQVMTLTPANKVIAGIKRVRPDVFLIGSKTTTGDTRDGQVAKAMRQMSETGADMVLANDTETRQNLLVYPNGAVIAGSRQDVLEMLVSVVRNELGGKYHD